MKCIHCQRDIPEGAKICPECGTCVSGESHASSSVGEQLQALSGVDGLNAKPATAHAPNVTQKPQTLTRRIPPGFQAAPDTRPEPYTKTGLAQSIIHEATGIELVYIPAGHSMMGSPKTEQEAAAGLRREWVEDEVQHQVTISQGFYMGKYEVTQAQWQKLMGNNPSYFQNAGMDAPVEQVSWDDCQEFCRKAGSGLRLPTEAEWEYACRAGTTTAFHYGDSLDATMANFNGNYPYGRGVKGAYRETTMPVGQFKPNAWGLYDMHGNVWEWCQDWYGPYPTGAITDSKGPGSERHRVVRGGGWATIASGCRSATRSYHAPGGCGRGLGLRVCCSASPVQ